MAEAAYAWLDSLTAEQRSIASASRPPTNSFYDNERQALVLRPDRPRRLLAIHQQRPAQQQAAIRLVSTGCPRAAYVAVATIMGLENVLDYNEGFVVGSAANAGRDPGLSYLRSFGRPAARGHLGLAVRRAPRVAEQSGGGRCVGVDDAMFPGRDPAVFALLGGIVNRPLARVEDLGQELVPSLHPISRRRAILLPRRRWTS